MRVGLGQFNEATDEMLQYIKQCGVNDFLLNTPKLPGEERWEFEDLAALRSKAESYNLRLMALENVPTHFYDKIMLGQVGREEQLENMCQTVRNMGRAGIPILGYHFMPTGVWRTSRSTLVRGGAKATSFNLNVATSRDRDAFQKRSSAKVDREYTEEEMWENYDWYMERILPVCEEANVGMALHPDDPPVNYPLGGVARLFRNFENFSPGLRQVQQPDAWARLLPWVLVGNAGRRGCDGCDSLLRQPEKDILRSPERRSGPGRRLYGMLDR